MWVFESRKEVGENVTHVQ